MEREEFDKKYNYKTADKCCYTCKSSYLSEFDKQGDFHCLRMEFAEDELEGYKICDLWERE